MKVSSTTKMINTIFNYQEPVGFCLYILMIIGFTFFYSNLQIDAEKISDDLKKNGGSIELVLKLRTTLKEFLIK